jgi:hypothetical protein
MPETEGVKPSPTETAAKQTHPIEELLQTLPNAPSMDKIKIWQQQVPAGRVRCFSPDGKRMFYLRGLTGLELATITKSIPENSSNPDYEIQLKSVAIATLWANVPTDETSLRGGTAGLPNTLYQIVQNLSDFFDPVQIFNLSFEF